jgi:DNA-binding phage protein
MAASRKTRAKTKREAFTRYDTADHLGTAEEIEAYPEAVLQEGSDDPWTCPASVDRLVS